jgi:uncharacterized protein YkuJ
MKRFIAVLIILLAIFGLAYYFYSQQDSGDTGNGGDGNGQEITWVTYRNAEYNFELEYPSTWAVAEFDDIPLAINIYDPETVAGTLAQPLIHFSNATFVGIFPDGVGTEGVLGQTQTSEIDLDAVNGVAVDYLLEDGKPWATFAKFEEYPNSWNISNYAWGAVRLNNLEMFCAVNGVPQGSETCELPMPDGAEQIRRADINEQDRQIVVRILESIRFTDTRDQRAPVSVDNPEANAIVTSPLTISGEARGTWFFEASFPVELRDGGGNVIASGIVQAQTEWMVESFVPFYLQLTFSDPETATGSLALIKDNPSGLPENDDEIIIPVRFE